MTSVIVYNAAGGVQFNSANALAGMCLGSFSIPPGNTFFKNFPLLTGCVLRAFQSYGYVGSDVASPSSGVSYPGGIPSAV